MPMLRALVTSLLMAFLIGIPASKADSASVQIFLQGQGGYVGGSNAYYYDNSTGTPTVQASQPQAGGAPSYLSINYNGNATNGTYAPNNVFAEITISTAQLGIPLLPGTYNNAQRAPFATVNHPGLDIGLNGAGCNTVAGSFVILDAAYNGLTVVRFDATFQLFCEGQPPALTGRVRINEPPMLTELPAGGAPFGITAGPDQAMWFTDVSSARIGRIDPAGNITYRTGPTNGQAMRIASGSDGALWFAENMANKIGRVTTAGAFTEFNIPTASSRPYGIVAGPDGALWFTENAAGKIGRITTAGAITEYSIPTGGSAPMDIAAGADGALWFTESGANKIGRITTAGAVTDYAVVTAGSQPSGITAGGDGNLWFTEPAKNQIGKVTTFGIVTEYPIPTASSGATEIAAGPDGELWFSERNVGQIGRITTTGFVTETATSTTGTQPRALAQGSDGNMYFAEAVGNIGKAILAHSVAVAEAGTGTGVVSSSPSGIACGTGPNICSGLYHAGQTVALTATAASNSTFTGWSGAGCTGISTCVVSVDGDTTVTANFMQLPSNTLSIVTSGDGSGTVTSNPAGINCGAACIASFSVNTSITLSAVANSGSTFVGWAGGACSGTGSCTVTPVADTAIYAIFQANSGGVALNASILPASRSVAVGSTATAFAALVNSGPGTAFGCSVIPTTGVPGRFSFQATNPTTNIANGAVNAAVDIPTGAFRTFVVAFTPSLAVSPTDVAFAFSCTNGNPAPSISGLNTLFLSASTTPTPDIVAVAGTLANDGIVNIPLSTQTGVFVVATSNVGASGAITASADAGFTPVSVSICQTDPASGVCLASPSSSVSLNISANATPTFGIFVSSARMVPFAPGSSRVYVRFKDASGLTRGLTSVAVRTQ